MPILECNRKLPNIPYELTKNFIFLTISNVTPTVLGAYQKDRLSYYVLVFEVAKSGSQVIAKTVPKSQYIGFCGP